MRDNKRGKTSNGGGRNVPFIIYSR